MTRNPDHEAIFALLAAAVPDDLVVPVLDRLDAASLLATATPDPGWVGPVLAHGTPAHLAVLAANPELTRAQLRALAAELALRAAEPAAGAGRPERLHLSAAAERAYVHRRSTPRLRHHLANGPLGEELAERLHHVNRIDCLRPLAVTGNPRVLLRILTTRGDLVTEAEQADAVLRLLSAGQAHRIVQLLGHPRTTAPRRRVRRELRRLLGEYDTLPAGAGDPRAAALVLMARRPDRQGGLTGLLRERPQAPHFVLPAPIRRDPAELVRRHLHKPLPVPVRTWMLLWDDLEPDVARAFLHHGPSPVPAPRDVRYLAALAVRFGLLSLDDVVRATAPVRLLPGLIMVKSGGGVPYPISDPQLRDAGGQWLQHERSAMLRTVDTLLADAPPRGIVAAAETRPGSTPGTLPELLRAEPSGLGLDAELLHWLLTRAPATVVPDVIRALRPDDALSLAAVALRRDTPAILDSVLTLRTDPPVRDRLVATVPDAARDLPDTGTRPCEAPCIPPAERAGSGRQRQSGRGPGTPTTRRSAGHDSQASRPPVDWAAVTARYRDGVADEPRDAWLLAQHPELPEELAPLLINAHPGLFSSSPDTGWNPVLVRAFLPRLRRRYDARHWVGVHLAHGTLTAADLLRHGIPARLALPRRGREWYRPAVLPDKPLADEVRRRLGSRTDDGEMWAVAARLLPAFPGTLAELFDAAVADARTGDGVDGSPGKS
ncbi:hypothetical protein [Streptomyces sp. 2224.1]|uniref:hypothetical protein n=1 Tax=Streptomyces sp. 2224.1 TaxID=1881020 RepID=UPI0015A35A05|nr:hypothetical protein [Streptomyces sp. 2224.1]